VYFLLIVACLVVSTSAVNCLAIWNDHSTATTWNSIPANIRNCDTTRCLIDQQVRFPGDIFTKIQNLQFYRHLLGRVTNTWDHTDPVYPSNSSVKGHLPENDSPNIN